MNRCIPIVIALALTLGACGEESPAPEPEAPTTAEQPTAEAEDTEDEELAVSAEDFPLPEDFEEEAAAEISADNLEDQVAALEAELAE